MAAGVLVPPPAPFEPLPLPPPDVVEGVDVEELELLPSLPPELQARLARANPDSVKPIQSHFMKSDDLEVRCVMLPLVSAMSSIWMPRHRFHCYLRGSQFVNRYADPDRDSSRFRS